jgi:hypothetical protein
LTATHGDPLPRVFAVATFLLNEVAVHHRSAVSHDGAVIDVLPPLRWRIDPRAPRPRPACGGT